VIWDAIRGEFTLLSLFQEAGDAQISECFLLERQEFKAYVFGGIIYLCDNT